MKELYGLDVSEAEFTRSDGLDMPSLLRSLAEKYGAISDTVGAQQRFFEIYLEGLNTRASRIYPGTLFSGARQILELLNLYRSSFHCCKVALAVIHTAGAALLVRACREAGLKTAVASSTDRIQVCFQVFITFSSYKFA